MMIGSHFYLTLPSNASLDVFPNNKTTGYHVKLPKTIDLNGMWEVGLYSISYPYTWYTLSKANHIHVITEAEMSKSISVNYGYYNTMEDLIEAVKDAIKIKLETKYVGVKLSYNARTEKVTVHLRNKHKFALVGRMSQLLGFGGEEIKLTKTTESPYIADLFNVETIYLYCDIVEPQIVGDANVRLLKSIPVHGKSGDIISKTSANIQYVPVRTKSFESVEILLRNDAGKPVPFERGKVVVTLHFRQLTQF